MLDLSATPGLWPALTQALDGSKYVVLLASPEAATSAWVSREYWLDHRRSEEILISLTGGEIVWDAQLGDFDWRATTALPTILKGAFKSEPLFVDLRGLQANEVVLANPRFATSVATFAAAITGQSLPDIVGEDVRQHRRIRRLALVMVLLFFSLSRCSFLFTRASFERSALGLRRRLACWSRIAVAKSLSRAVAFRWAALANYG